MKPYVEPLWGWDEEFQDNRYKQHWEPSKLQIILSEGKVVGYLETNKSEAEIYITNIHIDPELRGNGLGGSVIEDIKKTASAEGLKVVLQVLKTNEPAKRLYDRLGFATIEEAENHFRMSFS